MKFLSTGLDEIPWVRHGFFTRVGGMSGGVFASFNCGLGSGDDPDSVRANRAKAAEALHLEPGDIVTLYQVHSAKAVKIEAPFAPGAKPPEADALVTSRKGLGLAVVTADCAPVLLAARGEKIVAAVHAGWKGALGGVLEAAVKGMEELGAKPAGILAAIGPCIAQPSYEVRDDLRQPFLKAEAGYARFFKEGRKDESGEQRFLFDLPGFVAERLKSCGVGAVFDTRQDTLANETAYFSYRRSVLRGEKDYGRQLSMIAIS